METKPLSGREYAALQSLFAAFSHLTSLTPHLEKRARMLPGLYRDLRLLEVKTDSVMRGILTTVPAEKLQHIKADIEHVSLYIKVEPPGLRSMSAEGFSYVPTDVLNELLSYVLDHECLACGSTAVESRKCPYRRMFENALPHEIPGKGHGDACRYQDFSLGLTGKDDE